MTLLLTELVLFPLTINQRGRLIIEIKCYITLFGGLPSTLRSMCVPLIQNSCESSDTCGWICMPMRPMKENGTHHFGKYPVTPRIIGEIASNLCLTVSQFATKTNKLIEQCHHFLSPFKHFPSRMAKLMLTHVTFQFR